MQTIAVDVDAKNLILRLENGQRRLGYAAVNAINNTAMHVRAAAEHEVRDSLQIRKPEFWFGRAHAAAFVSWASVKNARAWAEISLSTPPGRGTTKQRFLGPLLEEGGIKKPSAATAKRIAVPITGSPARPRWGDPVQPEYQLSKIKLRKYGRNKQGRVTRRRNPSVRGRAQSIYGTAGHVQLPAYEKGTFWKGERGTYMILKRGGGGTIFARSAGKSVPIWIFRKPMRVPKHLDWMMAATDAANRWLPEEIERETIKAIQHSRGRGL